MNIIYKNPGYAHSMDSISLFLTGEETAFWSAPIFHFYPQLDKHTLMSLNSSDKHKYLNDVFRNIYENLSEEINKKTISKNGKNLCQMIRCLRFLDIKYSPLLNYPEKLPQYIP